ncbi:processing peptidase [Thalassoporum mexicanum PCC 7367]|uniref:M16 family metallopeptidase n=1 Tax=Thalassoporum mexicanum TaxID=3457544 RepID=UPI00029F97AE|nr:pitrilysin family protein [Pseudanabaena sp. PCC 7367]AFY68960.1 processing peptidase [Pseudanabaena sp. PCC 7367]
MVKLLQRLVHHKTLANGLLVVVVENPTADIVATRCFLKGGTRIETSDRAGLVHLASSLVTRGTVSYSSQEIAEQVESIGASLGTESAADYFLLSFKTITDDFAEILALAAEILRSPTFCESELELERRLTIQAIKSQQERPFSVAYDHLQQLLYGAHPYGFPTLGTEDSIGNLGRQQLIDYHQAYFRPEQMVVSIAGKIEPAAAIAQVEAALGDWQVDMALPSYGGNHAEFTPKQTLTWQDTQQAIVMLGYPAPAVGSPDYAALKLITAYLGSGLSSRLFVELREKRGLAYEVSAFYPTRLEASQFVAYMGTAPQNALTAREGLQAECDRLAQGLLEPDELAMTKSKLIGQYALSKQTNAQIANAIGLYETLGLGADYDEIFTEQIKAVTLAEIERVAQHYFAQPAISVVGPDQAMQQLQV